MRNRLVLRLIIVATLLSACGNKDIKIDNKVDTDLIKQEAVKLINNENVKTDYISDSAYYIETSNHIYRFQLDNNGKIKSTIKYNIIE